MKHICSAKSGYRKASRVGSSHIQTIMNRNLLNISIALFFVAAVTSGCSKDTPSDPVRGRISYQLRTLAEAKDQGKSDTDTIYTFTQTIFNNYGKQPGSDDIFEFDFQMISLGINQSSDTLAGVGNYINFEMESANKLSPVPGVYKFNKKPSELGISKILFGEFYDSLDFKTGSCVRADTITNGTLVFTKNGSGIIVTIDCTTKLGRTLKGSYAGDAISVTKKESRD